MRLRALSFLMLWAGPCFGQSTDNTKTDELRDNVQNVMSIVFLPPFTGEIKIQSVAWTPKFKGGTSTRWLIYNSTPYTILDSSYVKSVRYISQETRELAPAPTMFHFQIMPPQTAYSSDLELPTASFEKVNNHFEGCVLEARYVYLNLLDSEGKPIRTLILTEPKYFGKVLYDSDACRKDKDAADQSKK